MRNSLSAPWANLHVKGCGFVALATSYTVATGSTVIDRLESLCYPHNTVIRKDR